MPYRERINDFFAGCLGSVGSVHTRISLFFETLHHFEMLSRRISCIIDKR